MKKIVTSLFSLVCSPLLAQTGLGRGYNPIEDAEEIYTFETALFAFCCGIVFIIAGVILYNMYKARWKYDEDKGYINTISQALKIIGIISLIPFVQKVWYIIIPIVLIVLVIGYITYYIGLKENEADEKKLTISAYLSAVLAAIKKYILWE